MNGIFRGLLEHFGTLGSGWMEWTSKCLPPCVGAVVVVQTPWVGAILAVPLNWHLGLVPHSVSHPPGFTTEYFYLFIIVLLSYISPEKSTKAP